MSSLSEAAKAVFLGAVDITSPPERSAYLDKACEGNAELRARVEALLKDHDEAGDFLEKTALGQDATLEPPPLTEGPGTVVGRYKLLEQIGEGGMGVVFMAEQEEPIRRTVALKIIKPGMDTRQVIARFEAERQALALMDHPNIARVLDAGATQTGRPYFVMELAKGVPLTEYCDANRLSTPERLALFIEVCHAVQHAHQKGIIHRDLKPSNVLVTLHDGRPVPKIIDFGVAKATSQRLTEKTMFTSYGQMIGTPAYMSPEQAEMGGLDVDTRSDIYALGVLLYELLTGTTPFDEKHLRSAGYQEIQRIIREVEPLKPSTRLSNRKDTLASVAASRRTEPARLARLVRGDLDWIVMKTLEKDRARRYETADGLVLDIQHYLAHEPVLAGPPGAAYRARKFLRRHRTGIAAGLLVFLALAAGLAAATVGLLRARDSARAAKQETAKAEAVTRFFQKTLEAIDPENARGRELTVREVFDNAAKDIGTKFAGQPLVEAAVRETLGTTYLALGDYAAAHSQLSSAFGVRRRILGEEHPDTLTSMTSLANVLYAQSKGAEAAQWHRQTLQIRQRVLGQEHPDTLASMRNLARVLAGVGRAPEAEQLDRQCLEIRRRVLGNEHPETLRSMVGLANALAGREKGPEAEQLYRETLDAMQRCLGHEHLDTLACMDQLGKLLCDEWKWGEAERIHRQVLEIRRRVQGEEHPATLQSLNNLATDLDAQHEYAEAEKLHRQVLGIRLRVLGEEHHHTLSSMLNLAHSLGPENPEREQLLRRVLEIRRRVLGQEHPDTLRTMVGLGGVFRLQGRLAEAVEIHRQVFEIFQRVSGKEAPETLGCKSEVAVGMYLEGHFAESERLQRQCLESLQRVLGEEHIAVLMSMAEVWNCLEAQGKRAEAEQMWRERLARQQRLLGKENLTTLWSVQELADELLDQGRPAEAEKLYKDVLAVKERVLGKEHPETLAAAMSLGETLRRQAKHDEAALLGTRYPPLPKPVRPEVRAAWQGEMQRRARAIKATVVEQGQQVPVDVVPEALWRYTQPGMKEGSLWACGRTGRPVALVGMAFNQRRDGTAWGSYEFVSLSSGPVTAAGEGDWKWSPKKPGAEFKPLPDGPAPAEDAAGRLGQMKELLRRFTAPEKPLLGKELTLLEGPVHRYADPERGLLDGAVFVFAEGTDPEVILLLELRRADKASPPQWQYALARMSAAEVWINLDGTEVWRRPVAHTRPEDEYAVFGAPYLPNLTEGQVISETSGR